MRNIISRAFISICPDSVDSKETRCTGLKSIVNKQLPCGFIVNVIGSTGGPKTPDTPSR